jgi:predicted exporter
LGGVIAGVTVDYAIHVYTAIRHGRDRAKAVGSVVAPILLGAVTISCAFGAFLASSIEGYRQLGVFSIVGVGLAVVLALFVFPLLVKPGKAAGEPAVPAQWRLRSRRGDAWLSLIFLAVCVAAAILATRVNFDSDMARLDGTARDILDSETRFRTVWGRGEGGLGMLAVTDADREKASERYQQIHEQAVAAVGFSNVVSLATLWPARSARDANLRNWANFWRGGREERLRKLLAEKGAPFSFAADAFDPFFEGLYRIQSPSADPAGNMVFDQVRDRFIRGGEGRWSYILYFPDRPEVVRALTQISAEHPGSLLVSREAFMKSMSRVYSREIGTVTGVGMVLIVLAIFLGIRDFRFSCLALLPAAVGGLWLLGLMGWLGYAFTIGNLMAGIVVLGLCIDYGVLMVHGFRHGETRGPRTAVTMSAVTTVVGTGVLLFARHPVLFSVGLTLTVGVIAGYVAAILVLPSLNALWCGDRDEDAN